MITAPAATSAVVHTDSATAAVPTFDGADMALPRSWTPRGHLPRLSRQPPKGARRQSRRKKAAEPTNPRATTSRLHVAAKRARPSRSSPPPVIVAETTRANPSSRGYAQEQKHHRSTSPQATVPPRSPRRSSHPRRTQALSVNGPQQPHHEQQPHPCTWRAAADLSTGAQVVDHAAYWPTASGRGRTPPHQPGPQICIHVFKI